MADELSVARVGPQHQAGSDSLLTAMAFFELRRVHFKDEIDDATYLGHLYGLGAQQQAKDGVYLPDSSNSHSKHINTLIAESYDPNGRPGATGIVSTATANDVATNVIASMGPYDQPSPPPGIM